MLRAVLPHATGYKNEIQQEISQQIGLPVEIESIDAAINWFSPRLKLIRVTIFDKKNKVPLFDFREAFVELDVFSSIFRQELIIADIGLIGADISIEKFSDNEWSVQGVKFTSEGSTELPDQFLYMLQNADYLLHDSNIYYQDNTGDKLSISLLNVNVDVENNFNNHDIKFSMNLPEEFGGSLAVVANLHGELNALDGDVFIEADNLKIKRWNKKFRFLKTHQLDAQLDINLWVTFKNSDLQSLTTSLSARNLFIKNNQTGKNWKTDYLGGDFRWVKNQANWNLAVSDFYFGKESKPVWGRLITVLAGDDDEQVYLSADFLRITDLQMIAEVMLEADLLADFQKLKNYQLKADIYNLSLQLPKQLIVSESATEQALVEAVETETLPNPNADADATKEVITKAAVSKDEKWRMLLDNLHLQMAVSDFSINDSNNSFKLTGLDASMSYRNNRLVFDVLSENTTVELSELFREPMVFETVQGKLTLDTEGESFRLNAEQLQLKNKHINTFSRLDARLSSENKLFVDVQTNFYEANVKYTHHYLPTGIMDPGLVEWLEMAVNDGYVPQGSFILQGNLDDFPFHDNNGVFQVLFSAQDINMKFLENWPLLTDTSAKIKFNNLSLFVEHAKGKTQSAELFNGYAEILNLPDPHLMVEVEAHSKNEDLQSYVWSSPLDDILGDSIRLFQFGGENDLKLTLQVALNEDQVNVEVEGHLNFIDSDMYYTELGYQLDSINGVIDFTNDSVFADSVSAKIQNRPVSINAYTQDGTSGRQVVFNLEGVLEPDYLLQRYDWIPLHWISGQSRWSIDIEIPNEPEDYLVHVSANSYLEGVVFEVSDKVNKTAFKKMKFSTEIDILESNLLSVDATMQDYSAEDVVHIQAVRDGNKVWNFDVKSAFVSGKGAFAESLDKDTQIKLALENIDLHALFVASNRNKSGALKPGDFPALSWRAKNVLWDDWHFTDVKLETDWHKHGMLINTLSLKGPAMTFDARGTWLTSWSGAQETVLQGNINSSNFGTTLTGLGFERSLDRCDYQATFNVKWPAEPFAFSWANMKGQTSFEMTDGEVLEVDPGAGGRMLGLLNIFKLANRLAFDFDDVTRKGFSFDKIKGDFEFVNGDGSLKDVNVSAAAADINMFGSIGLINRDYGLLMRVKPHTDTLTFAGGVLLGGVAVGAGLALIQKVFDLSIVGHNVYSITGSWDDPVVEKIIQNSSDISEDDDF